jgi:hypothetical protein
MSSLEIRVPEISASDFEIQSAGDHPSEAQSPESFQARLESPLPKDYETRPIFSYNIDTTKNLTWDSDAKLLHGIWMQNANTAVPHDRYPHAAIKRLMRLNPEVFQVCSEVLAPFSLLADMFVGMLLLGASGVSDKQQAALTEKDVMRSIALNPLLTWALDLIDVEELLNMEPRDDPTIFANILPELLVRQHPKNVMKKLIKAHFTLLSKTDRMLGDVPVIVGANGHVITKLDALGPGDVSDRLTVAQNLVAGTESQVFILPTNESQNQIEDSIGTSEIGPSTRVTKNLSLHENGYNFSTEESSYNMTCQKNQEAVKVHPQATLSQMQYVKFFSHIEPVWFPDDREYVDAPLDFMNNGGEVPCT